MILYKALEAFNTTAWLLEACLELGPKIFIGHLHGASHDIEALRLIQASQLLFFLAILKPLRSFKTSFGTRSRLISSLLKAQYRLHVCKLPELQSLADTRWRNGVPGNTWALRT